MAKVKFSALVSEMRNKLNGSVFARNRGGAYLRTKVTPNNPKTTAQVQARNLLAQFSQSWRSLTQAERDSFSAAVGQWTRTDIFGDVVNPTGATLYIRLNINISLAGGSAITTAPQPIGADALSSITIVADVSSNAVDVTFAPGTVPTLHTLYIELTPQVSAGVNNVNSQFRFIKTVPTTGTTPASLFTEYTAKFGGLVAGSKIAARAKFIRFDTGEVSQSLTAFTIVAP